MIRREFLKKIGIAVLGITGIDVIAEKLVVREASHDFGVLLNEHRFWMDSKKMMENAWDEAKKMLNKEHRSSLWKGVFVPSRIEFKSVEEHTRNYFFDDYMDNYRKFLFKMTGVSIEDK